MIRIHILLVLLLTAFVNLKAQLCTGSLGDPVVNLTFGSGTNGGTSYSPPGYTYTAATCPNDGFYTITNVTSNCFNSTWHTVNNDHTGGGNFMLVNASFQPADFFVGTVTGLCPNTTYEFSAWILNVLISPAGIKPNLTFTIETPAGAVLQTMNTGDITVTPSPVWRQYGFFFTTTAGNPDIVLRITNNAPGGMGNDLALDDITFRPCGPSLSSSILGNSDNVDICTYDQPGYTFNAAISSGFLNPVFQWQISTDSTATWKDIPGATTLNYQRQPTVPGRYWYRLTVAEDGNAGISSCRIASNVLLINVHPRPVVNAGPDRIIRNGGKAQLTAAASGENITIAWSPPEGLNDPLLLNPVAAPVRDTWYRLTATSVYGCTNDDVTFVQVVAGIFVPTAFTPNNDGRNDYWRIPYLDPLLGAKVSVFNRYGQLVYAAAGTAVNWDGTFKGIPQDTGTFVYLIQFSDGTADMKGTFTLIR
ncbi:MAG TPA: T9SS type B sorting domain-containing protein [Chitinophagaceae bacterium]|nr:T9SS type B sorting domain-containing protein [Chitinophagaceae bacterium]